MSLYRKYWTEKATFDFKTSVWLSVRCCLTGSSFMLVVKPKSKEHWINYKKLSFLLKQLEVHGEQVRCSSDLKGTDGFVNYCCTFPHLLCSSVLPWNHWLYCFPCALAITAQKGEKWHLDSTDSHLEYETCALALCRKGAGNGQTFTALLSLPFLLGIGFDLVFACTFLRFNCISQFQDCSDEQKHSEIHSCDGTVLCPGENTQLLLLSVPLFLFSSKISISRKEGAVSEHMTQLFPSDKLFFCKISVNTHGKTWYWLIPKLSVSTMVEEYTDQK